MGKFLLSYRHDKLRNQGLTKEAASMNRLERLRLFETAPPALPDSFDQDERRQQELEMDMPDCTDIIGLGPEIVLMAKYALACPALVVIGFRYEEGTKWWGIWRRNALDRNPILGNGAVEVMKGDIKMIAPLKEGHLEKLYDEVDQWERKQEKDEKTKDKD